MRERKIDWLIQLISIIRSTKVDLDISPGSFIDISIDELKKDKKSIIEDNLIVFKRLGRINNIISYTNNKKSVNIILGVESITLYFDEDVNLSEQKLTISKKVSDLDNKLNVLVNKLENKSFLKNAPKSIVEKEKNSLIQYKIELKKLNSILNSIKN